jgi:hypothetical protein
MRSRSGEAVPVGSGADFAIAAVLSGGFAALLFSALSGFPSPSGRCSSAAAGLGRDSCPAFAGSAAFGATTSGCFATSFSSALVSAAFFSSLLGCPFATAGLSPTSPDGAGF